MFCYGTVCNGIEHLAKREQSRFIQSPVTYEEKL